MPAKFLDEKKIAYASIGMGVVVFIYAFSVVFSLAFMLASTALLAAGAVMLKAGDWIIPCFLAGLGRYPLYKNMELREDAVLVQDDGAWRATGFLELQIVRSIADLSDHEKTMFFSTFHNFLVSVDHGLKVSTTIVPIDLGEEVKRVRVKLEGIRFEKTRTEDEYKKKQLEDDEKYWKKFEERLTSERPLDIIMHVQVTERGSSKDEAVARMRSERRKITGAIAASLAVDVKEVRGRDLRKYIELDLIVPANYFEVRKFEW